ncbi:hypothetical protein MHJ98_06025 [Corynebacterium afermentans]|uniref:hypothetical protein n=1 Tax=Corynebacterium afermentans TaxID=38286 RepID=UPI00257223F0|nr:hypothetical protein [Corynebacterium afermentans]MCG7291911.1 hypothetical protein [Corynebacterium afermentans]
MKIRTLAMTATLAGIVALAPTAGADAIDDALAKMPSGPISCDQASRYWTNDADYQQKVRQARAIAAFDRRGPQILDALSRVDEAANRCGLKGGAKPAQPKQSNQNNQTNQQQPQPKQPQQTQPKQQQAQNPQNLNVSPQLINLAPAGVPTVEVPVANVVTLQLPDIIKIIQQALAQILAYFNIQV